MPLTEKGEKILSAMEKSYGSKKKGEEVFYASKNAGKISGVDSAGEEEEGGVGAESWVGGKKNSTGYKINAADEISASSSSSSNLPPTPVGSTPSTARQSAVPTAMDRLPTIDQFRRQFRDAVRAGLPIQKCLEMGTVWTGMNSPGTKFQGDKATFKRTMDAALAKGMSFKDAIRLAADEVAPQRADLGKPSGIGVAMDEEKGTPRIDLGTISGDKKVLFRGAMRDALGSGKSARDAIKHALDSCTCGQH